MLLGALTLILVLALLIVGIPALTQVALFFSRSPVNDSSENEDVLAPLPPQINTPPEATNSSQLSLSGFAESGAEVSLKRDDVEVQTSIADASGSFSFAKVSLRAGTNTFSLVAIDPAGNESPASAPVHIEYDNTQPKLTITEPTEGKKFFGQSERLITIKGETDQDAHVSLAHRSLVVGSDGTFTTSFELQEGENQLELSATDKAGNSTTTTLSISYQP